MALCMLDVHVVHIGLGAPRSAMMRLIRMMQGLCCNQKIHAASLLSERYIFGFITTLSDRNCFLLMCTLVKNFLFDVEVCVVDQQYMPVVQCINEILGRYSEKPNTGSNKHFFLYHFGFSIRYEVEIL